MLLLDNSCGKFFCEMLIVIFYFAWFYQTEIFSAALFDVMSLFKALLLYIAPGHTVCH